VKQSEQGELEYIGRNDFQIKIRGHRVEIEEIINVIETYKDVNMRATVKPFTKDGNIILTAYVTCGIEINTSKVLEYLRTKLPTFMVPNYVIQLSRFPETLNGKIDMNKLPSPFDTDHKISFINSNKYIKPKNKMENQIQTIWSKILGIEEISVVESIYNIGFTSIMLPNFLYAIKQEFNVVLTAEEFIKNSTIRTCAKLLIQYTKK
jgi:acyl carrier protein